MKLKKTKNYKIDMNKIELIVYDFDGVMTDNKVVVDENGKESVIVNRADGLAIAQLKEKGIKQIIISTETNRVVKERAKKIKIDCLYGIENKKKTLEKYLKENKIEKSKVIYIGNDINDLEAMRFVGIKIAPADAADDIKEIATYITKRKGGEGVVREIFEILKLTY